jgi:hypothetical protein
MLEEAPDPTGAMREHEKIDQHRPPPDHATIIFIGATGWVIYNQATRCCQLRGGSEHSAA